MEFEFMKKELCTGRPELDSGSSFVVNAEGILSQVQNDKICLFINSKP